MFQEVYQSHSIDYDNEHGQMVLQEGAPMDAPAAIRYKDIPGMAQTTNFRPAYSNSGKNKSKSHPSLISRFFSNMSRMGMRYEDQVIANMKAIPADKSLVPKQVQLLNQDLFSSAASNWMVKSNADKDFFSKDLPTKRAALRKLAMQPELEEILDTFTNEAIVYDPDNTYFCSPFIENQELEAIKKSYRKKIQESMWTSFRRFYKMLNWKYHAWDDFKRFLVEGTLAWEIVWDSLSNPKKIIGLVPLDPATLTRKFENNKWYWIQFKGTNGRERKLLDSQVVYISYQETNMLNRTSYLERLIRPFNIYRIIEQAQLIWTITNASFKMRFTIPVKGMNRANGAQTLNSAMARYREDIRFQSDTGELTINGQSNLPFNKEYWMPETDSGSPQIDTLGGDGPDLADNDQLKFFRNQLYKMSKIPLSRFDQDSGETWFGADASNVARTEIDFSRFVTRMRNVFSQIMVKPLQLQLACDFPELQGNRELLEAVSLQYHSYNVFEELLEQELMAKRVDFIQNMKDALTDQDLDGNDVKFFSSRFLVTKYLKMTQADLDMNDKMKQDETEDMNLAGGEMLAEVFDWDDPDREMIFEDTSLSPEDRKKILERLYRAIREKKRGEKKRGVRRAETKEETRGEKKEKSEEE